MLHCVVHLYYVPGSEKRDILRCACFKDMYGMEDLNKKVGCLQRRRVVYRGGVTNAGTEDLNKVQI